MFLNSLYQTISSTEYNSVISGLILTRREFKNSLYLGDTRISMEVVSRLIDTDGYGACIGTDTDLRKLIGVRHLLHLSLCNRYF